MKILAQMKQYYKKKSFQDEIRIHENPSTDKTGVHTNSFQDEVRHDKKTGRDNVKLDNTGSYEVRLDHEPGPDKKGLSRNTCQY